MFIEIRVVNVGDDSDKAWNEEIDTEKEGYAPGHTAPQYGSFIVDDFNNGLKDGEKARELIGAREIGEVEQGLNEESTEGLNEESTEGLTSVQNPDEIVLEGDVGDSPEMESKDKNIISLLEKGQFPVKIMNPERRSNGRATCLLLVCGEIETIIEPGQEIIIGIPDDDILTLTPMEK